jgi:hypothetical protein
MMIQKKIDVAAKKNKVAAKKNVDTKKISVATCGHYYHGGEKNQTTF